MHTLRSFTTALYVSKTENNYKVTAKAQITRFLFNSPNFNSPNAIPNPNPNPNPNPIPNPNPNPIIGIRRIEIRRIEKTPITQ